MQVASRIAPDYLVVSDVRLLEIVATAHHQKLESVFRACVPVELHGRARTLTKIIELLRFRWIEKSGRGESIDEEVVANASVLAAVIGVQVVIFERGAAKVYVSVATQISTRTRGDDENAAQTRSSQDKNPVPQFSTCRRRHRQQQNGIYRSVQ